MNIRDDRASVPHRVEKLFVSNGYYQIPMI
jgi:hypothetical protein